METFMGKRCEKINEHLYKMLEDCICSGNDIRKFKEFPIGILQRPMDVANDIINIVYFIKGMPERYLITDYLDDGIIPEADLYYMENPWFKDDIGGVEVV